MKIYVSDAEGKTKTPNFLIEELKTHLAQEPMKFQLLLQLPNPGDPTNDASIVWPDERKTIDLGTITTVDPNSDAAQKALAFDPTRLTDGIELSDDPLPALRSSVYRLSRIDSQGSVGDSELVALVVQYFVNGMVDLGAIAKT